MILFTFWGYPDNIFLGNINVENLAKVCNILRVGMTMTVFRMALSKNKGKKSVQNLYHLDNIQYCLF